jgi:Tfp pilus assembly protein PilV
MKTKLSPRGWAGAGFTLVEVLLAAFLIAIALGSIMAMNTQAIRTLRLTHGIAASSQMLQERIEMIRARPWPEVASAAALAILMGTATPSEREVPDPALVETMTVSAPEASAAGPADSSGAFSVTRTLGQAQVIVAGDLTTSPTLIFQSSLTWNDIQGTHRRLLRSVVCRAALTRSGVFGSGLGQAGLTTSAPSAP